jgi:hypothetical protein
MGEIDGRRVKAGIHCCLMGVSRMGVVDVAGNG